MATKLVLMIKSCFCCSLSMSVILIAIYTILLYSSFAGLAGWGISDTNEYGDLKDSNYDSCLREARGEIGADNRKLTFKDGKSKIIIEDSTSYQCSFGLYTAELKHPRRARYSLLLFNILLFILIVIVSLLLLVGIGVYIEWLFFPWIILMIVDVIRGIISVLFIFIYSHGNLARIAVGIFFLGLQILHISLIMIVVAKFQRIRDKKNGIDYRSYSSHPEKVMIADGQSRHYPVYSTNYGYTNSPYMHREAYYNPSFYNTYGGKERQYRQDDTTSRVYRPPESYNTIESTSKQETAKVIPVDRDK